jgi:hypothetical protein
MILHDLSAEMGAFLALRNVPMWWRLMLRRIIKTAMVIRMR